MTINSGLKEIKGMTLPKFKKEYRKQLERLWVDKYVVEVVCDYKDFTTLSSRTFKNSDKDVDWFICRVVFLNLCKKIGVKGLTYNIHGDYRKYHTRKKEVEEYEKSLLESGLDIVKMSVNELQSLEKTKEKEFENYRYKLGSDHWLYSDDKILLDMEEKLFEIRTIIRLKE